MRSGELDRRITIQNKMLVRNTFGEEVESWVDFITIWAKVSDVKGSEGFNSDKRIGVKDSVFKVRYRSDLNIEMRISYNNDIYEITSIAELGRREGLNVFASAINPVDV